MPKLATALKNSDGSWCPAIRANGKYERLSGLGYSQIRADAVEHARWHLESQGES